MSDEEAEEMIDPAWTPEAGYSHAARLLEIIREQEAALERRRDHSSAHNTNNVSQKGPTVNPPYGGY